jgi:geranylgeranyl diphosphate synthase type I
MKRVIGESALPHYAMMRYHLGWENQDGHAVDRGAGKMLRPALCLLACEAVGGEWDRAIPAAAAIEILHNFSLVHDDIEDGSDERHGRPTVWRLWGPAQAINVGDGMFALAHLAMLRLMQRDFPPALVLQALQMFIDATRRLCEGQYLDMSFEQRDDVSLDEYFQMISGKTAALLGAASGIGALLGGGSDAAIRALMQFGEDLGRAFQVYDDYLGIWGAPEQTGKSVYDDIRERKKSFPIVYTLGSAAPSDTALLRALYGSAERSDEKARAIVALLDRTGAAAATLNEARRLAGRAIDALAGEALVPDRAQELHDLVAFVVERSL